MAGITGYGTAIPYNRVSVEEIHRVWRNTSLDRIKNVLKVNERAVLQPNEDTITAGHRRVPEGDRAFGRRARNHRCAVSGDGLREWHVQRRRADAGAG